MSNLIDVVLPADQSEGTTNVVGTWFRAVGDRVEANDPLLEITTDKVTVEIASPASGVLAEILKAEGEQVEQGEVLGRVAEGASAGATPAPRPAPAVTPGEAPARSDATPDAGADDLTPAVRRLLREHGLEASQVSGTGRGGRITAQDVEAFVAGRGSGQAPTASGIRSHRVPHGPMRKSIAEHMVRSMQAAPHVTSVFEADMTAIIAHREGHKASFGAEGARLTFTAYFVRATVAAIRAVPEANSRWHADALEVWDEINIGIATALGPGGLIVPVLRNAEDLDLLATARGIQLLTDRAREGTLEPRDVQQGTFTISNHGVSGSLLAAPIVINQPQSAILGIGKVQQRPVVIAGQLQVRPMVYVTLTIDHRVLDGFSANAFLTTWVDTLERWS
ncbi:MAG TPA: 2-oxo acid dehydrogenase subunit E2 [Gemmatimonadales bacterium]|nr:2-oxo acid dehydrogenase subunit E2 [Gemmatimonadales bacterium]